MASSAPPRPPAAGGAPTAGAAARNLWLVPLYQAAAFGYAVIPFLWFLVSARGFDLKEYASLQSVYYCATLVAEVPTGLLADRLGRKVVLILAVISQAAGFVAFANARDFAAFACAQILLGLGQAMLSGTTAAILYDSLLALGREREYLRFETRATISRLCGSSFAFLVGGWLGATFGMEATAWASAGFSCVALPLAIAIAEPPRSGDSHSGASVFALLRASVRDLWSRTDLRWVAAVFALLFVELRMAFHLYTPGLERAGLTAPLAVGTIYALLNVVAAVSTRFAPRLAESFGEGGLLILLSLVLAASFAGLGFSTAVGSVLGWFVLQQVPFGVHFPVVASFVNHRVPSSRRATTLSCLSLLGRASFASAFPIVGAVADTAGLARTLLGIAVAFLVATIALGFVGRQVNSLSDGTSFPAP